MYRSHNCGQLRLADVGITVTLAGWVQTVRKFGSITFVDLRDRYGITQLLFGEELTKQLDVNPLGREFVIQVTGTVAERSNKNANLPSAGSSNLLCKMVDQLTAKVVTDATLHFVSGEQPSWLDDGPLAMHPMGLNAVEPGTLDRQPARNDAHTQFA